MGYVNKRDNKLIKQIVNKKMSVHEQSLSAHVKLLDEYRAENKKLKRVIGFLNKQIKELKNENNKRED